MRRALLLLACLALAPPVHAAITFNSAHNVTGGSSGGGGFTTGAVDLTGDNFLICFVSFDNGAADPTISDSGGHTWQSLTTYQPAAASPKIKIYYVQNATGNATHTFTLAGSGTYGSMNCAGFAGVATSSAFDQQNGAGSASVTNISTGSITPSQDNCLIVSMVSEPGGDPTVSESMTAMNGLAASGGNYYGFKTAYKIQTTATAINPNWDGSPTSVNRAATVASFRDTPPASSTARGGMLLMGVGR